MTSGRAAAHHYDVAIVGGGLVGCAAAGYLASAGASVVVIEQGDLNREASGRNAGSLHFQLEYRLVRHGNALAAQFAQIIPLTLLAMQDWQKLGTELDAELEMHGGLIVAESATDMERLEMRQALHSEWGLETRLLSASEVKKLAPYLADSVVGASFCVNEGHANPRLVTLAFAERAASLGAELRSGGRVTAIAAGGRGWQLTVQSRDGLVHEFECGKVLNAAGAWAGEIAAMAHLHLPIFPVPLTMNVLERHAPLIPHLVQHASEPLTVKQVSDGNILIGGGWPSRFVAKRSSNDYRHAEVLPANVLGNLQLAARLVPALRHLHLLRTWAGITGITTDQMPLLGEVPEAPGFFVAAGGAAFTLGPTFARLISEQMTTGSCSQPIDLYSPARFSHINHFMSAGRV
jgi:glycine/D-amino acid oxidase-like deaminating enzyme